MASALADAWFSHPCRPQIDRAARDHWRVLLHGWIADESMPLYIRKVWGDKAPVLTHASGRSLVPVDSGPAQWACWLAAANGQRSVTSLFVSFRLTEHRVALP